MDKEQMERIVHGDSIRGYIDIGEGRKEYWLLNTPENIAHFISAHQFEASYMIFTTLQDQFIMDTIGGFINECADKELYWELLPILVPLQMAGDVVEDYIAADADEVYDYMDRMEAQGLSM